jgi:hypothetical protein
MKTFGKELIIDLDKCDILMIRSLSNIQQFIDEMLEKTGMKAMCPMHSFYLPDTPENREKGIVGWSICQFIQTSSVVGHFCEDSDKGYGTMYLNFFSCKDFFKADVEVLCKKYFKGRIRNSTYVRRDATCSDFIIQN